MHIAFKCTYNNGGEGVYVGFNGLCSEDVIKHNIKSGRVFCGLKNGKCYNYMASGFKGTVPDPDCLECGLFTSWVFSAGFGHSGKKNDNPFKMHKARTGSLAVLTTRFPYKSEEERNIVGLFQIARIANIPETTVYAGDLTKVRLPVDIAKKLYFWDYYNTSKNRCFWGSGLFRYLDNEIALRILSDVRDVIREDDIRIELNKLLRGYQENKEIPEAQGFRILAGHSSLRSRLTYERKFGYGGEGENHKKLKEWVAKHPDFIGLPLGCTVEVEKHIFPSGDRPDIVFHHDNKSCVVEIETDTVLPGAYQAIKYRALLCAERSLSRNTDLVSSYLIAWHIPDKVKSFCDKYGIMYKEKRL